MRLNSLLPGLSLGAKIPLSSLEGGGFLTTGRTFYVDSVAGASGNTGTRPTSALSTIAAAVAKATASKGDIVVVMPGHSETVTSAITLSTAGMSVIGLGQGLLRPSITGNGTIDAINVTANNVLIENLQFPAPSTDDQTSDINVAASGVVIRNTYHIGSQTAKNKTDIITVASGGNDLLIDKLHAYNVTVDCVSAISLEAAVARVIIRDPLIQGTFSTAAIMDEAAATLVTIQGGVNGRGIIKNTKAATAVLSFANNSTGVCSNLFISGRHTTFASNIVPGTSMDFDLVLGVEEPALNSLVNPAADAE